MSRFFDFPITSKFREKFYLDSDGWNKGIDYGTPEGTAIDAVVGGTVISAGASDDGWGTSVKIKDAQGNTHNYGHLSSVAVEPGDKIAAGGLLGKSGNTGKSTGPHLSYDVWTSSGEYIDPDTFVTPAKSSTQGSTNVSRGDQPMAGKAPTPAQARTPNEDGPPPGTDPAKTYWTDKNGDVHPGSAAKAAQKGWKFNATATQEANYDPEKPATWTGDQRVNYLLGRGFTWSTKNTATAHGDTALWTAPNGEDYTESTALVAPANSPLFNPEKVNKPQRVTDDFGNIWEIDPSADGGKRFITNIAQKESQGAQPAQGTTKVTDDGSVYYFPPYGGAPVNQGKYPELANKPNLQFMPSDVTGTLIAIDPTDHTKTVDTGIKVGYPALSPDQKQAIDAANKVADQRFATGERVAGQDFSAGQTEAGQRFSAEQTASGQRFSAEQNASNQRFNAEQTASGQRFTAGESAADRAQRASEFARSQGFLEQQAAAQQALEKAKFRADVLTKPSDYISAAFESRGFASPTDRITHADLINSADYYRNGNAPTAGGLRGFAGGGMTTEPRFMVGDSPTGMPTGNEEIIDNPTGAPVRVTPANNQVEGGSDSFKQTEEAFAKEIASHQGIWTKEEWAVAQAKRKAIDAKNKQAETAMPQDGMPQGGMPRFALGTDYNPPVPGSSDWMTKNNNNGFIGFANPAGDYGTPPPSGFMQSDNWGKPLANDNNLNVGPLTLPNSTVPAIGTGVGSLPGGGGYYTGPSGAGTTGSPTAGGTFIYLQNILGLDPETAAKAAGFASVDAARMSVDKNYVSAADVARMTSLSGYENGGSRFGVSQAGLIDAARKFSPPAVSAALGGNRISAYRPATTGLTLQKLQQLTPDELQALSTRLGVEFNRSLSSEIAGLQSRFGDVVSRPRARLAL